jgi:MFS family permease
MTRRFFYGYWILLFFFLCQIFWNGLIMYSFSFYVNPLHEEFAWSRAGIMAIITIVYLSIGVASPLIGRLSSWYGEKNVIAVGASLLGLGFVLISTVRELWQFYLFAIFLGVGSSAIGVVPASAVISNWFQKRRGWAIGILGTGIGVGGFAVPPIVGAFFIPAFGWRNTCVISGLLTALIITPLSLLIIKSNPADMGLQPDGVEAIQKNDEPPLIVMHEVDLNLKMASRTPAFWSLMIALAAFTVANNAIFQSQVPYLQGIGFPLVATASVMSLSGFGSGVGKYFFGWLGDHVQAKYILVIGIGAQVTAITMLMTMKSTMPVIILIVYAIILGVSMGCWLPFMSLAVSRSFGLVSYGVIFGLMNLIFMCFGAAGPVAAGLIYDAYQSYYWAFILSYVLHGIALLAILLVRYPKIKVGATS